MDYQKAFDLISNQYPEKSPEWIRAQMDRAAANVDGEVEDWSDIVLGEFGIC